VSGEDAPSIDLIVSILSAIKRDLDDLYKMVEELKKLQKVNN
jgi:hypothetical protein